jgi:hypothetical protein
MSTSGRSTRRRTPARVNQHIIDRQRRPQWAALLLFAATLLFAACDDDGGAPAPTPTPPARTTVPPTATADPEPSDLASQIGPRGDLPVNDPIALAERYGVTDGRAPSSRPFAGEPEVGSSREFVVVRINGASAAPTETRATATLVAKSEHAYFYADSTLGVSQEAAQGSAEAFESETWPLITGVFGEPPSPGVDNDPRIIVLVGDLGGVGGYHSSDDLYVRAVRPLSNEAEMVYIDSSNRVGSVSFDVVLAHELQHLVLEQNDPDEDAWVNEGLSVTAEGLVGGAMSVIEAFEQAPTTQLNRWEFSNSIPHYGAGGAFFRYLADRFGGDAALGGIAQAEADGPAGVEEFLAAEGDGLPFVAAFADWLTANALNRAEGAYGNLSRPIDIFVANSLAEGESVDGVASQFGADYYELSGVGDGEYVLRFDGTPEVDVLPITAGDPFFWSNTGDNINTTLTLETVLDFQAPDDVEESSLTFQTWYDIEEWYDRGYVSISTDGGDSWRALPSTSATTFDPVLLAYGPGFDGRSGDGNEPQWIDERVDLTEFAGQTVRIRFEMVTDGGTHGEGWAVRNINLEGSDTAVEIDDADWASDGWVRIDGTLPQTYIVRIIGERADGEPVVLDVPLDADGDGELRFDASGVTDLLVAVAGTTEGTNVRAPYTISLARP